MSDQTFPVYYGDHRFMVNPSKLFNSSRRFAQLVQPFGSSANKAQLTILYDKFSARNVENFLKLAQGLQTDVQNSEMKEVCDIAKMFQADQICSTGVKYIQQNIDRSFFIPNNKYDDDEQYMMVELPIMKAASSIDVQFDVDDEEQDKPAEPQKTKYSTIIYEIAVDRRKMKCNRYTMSRNGETFFSAKKKGAEVIIGKGSEIHIKSQKDNHCAKIVQDQMENTIIADGQKIQLKYVKFPKSGVTSMSVSFEHNGQTLQWSPKEPKYNSNTGKYSLNLTGLHRKRPIQSSKNSAMVNSQGKIMFITRKMRDNLFEVECLPKLSPIIVFTFALSSIIGPSIDESPEAA